jgi:hypothetical protein
MERLVGRLEGLGYVLVNAPTKMGFETLRNSVDLQGLKSGNVSRV